MNIKITNVNILSMLCGLYLDFLEHLYLAIHLVQNLATPLVQNLATPLVQNPRQNRVVEK